MSWIPANFHEVMVLAQAVHDGVTAATPTNLGLTAGMMTTLQTDVTAALAADAAVVSLEAQLAAARQTRETLKGVVITDLQNANALAQAFAKANPTVGTPARMAQANFPLHAGDPVPSGIPTSRPVIQRVTAVGSDMAVDFRDEGSPHSEKRPDDVKGANFEMSEVGAGGPWTHIDLVTHHMFTIHFDPSKAGTRIYLHAQWVSKNKQASKGPWSEVFIAVVGG
jgi:hypothetical protein